MASSFYFILFFTSLRNKLAFPSGSKQAAIYLRDYFRNKGYRAFLQVMGTGDNRKLVLTFVNLRPEDWILIKQDRFLRGALYDGVVAAVYGHPAEDFTRTWYLGRYGEELPGQPHYP